MDSYTPNSFTKQISNFNDRWSIESIDPLRTILSICFDGQYVGCAFYDIEKQEISIANPILGIGTSNFSYLTNMIRYTQPKWVLFSDAGRSKDLLGKIEMLIQIDLMNGTIAIDGTLNSNCLKIIPFNRKILFHNRERIMRLQLPGVPDHLSEVNQKFLIESLFPVQIAAVVNSLGNLLHYLETSNSQIITHPNSLEYENHIITNIRLFHLRAHLMVNSIAIQYLQVYNYVHHPSSMMYNSEIQSKYSLYSILNRCESKSAIKHVQTMLNQPFVSMHIILLYLNTVDVLRAQNCQLLNTFIGKIKLHLKSINDIQALIKLLSMNSGNMKTWTRLKQSLYFILKIVHLCKNLCRDNTSITNSLINLIAHADTMHVERSLYIIENIIDLDEMQMYANRFIVKVGIDGLLDAKKMHLFHLKDELKMYVLQESDNIPTIFNNIDSYYIPEVGFTICITFDSNNGIYFPFQMINTTTLKFIANCEDKYFFITTYCEKLNEKFGQLSPEIDEHENRIGSRILSHIAGTLPFLLQLAELIAQLDVSISFAKIAIANSLCRPNFLQRKSTTDETVEMSSSNSDKTLRLQINDGWNLLKRNNLMRNMTESKPIKYSTCIGGSKRKSNLITIIMAPNGCGKSYYLKQLALIAFMAHLGCPIPATKANLPFLDGIYASAYQSESIYCENSSFLNDMSHLNTVLSNCTGQSLIVIDEFGSGTTPEEGEAILCSVIKYFNTQATKLCPIILIATHYINLFKCVLGETEVLKTDAPNNILFQTIEYEMLDNGNIQSQYKLSDFDPKTSNFNEYYTKNVAESRNILDYIENLTNTGLVKVVAETEKIKSIFQVQYMKILHGIFLYKHMQIDYDE